MCCLIRLHSATTRDWTEGGKVGRFQVLINGRPAPVEFGVHDSQWSWADGGATRLDNLLLLCRRHHRLVHEGGVSVDESLSSTMSRMAASRSAVNSYTATSPLSSASAMPM